MNRPHPFLTVEIGEPCLEVLEASAEALCKAAGVDELVKLFDRSMVVLDIGFAPWKATLLGTFFDVDKALKDNFLGIMLEIWEHASTQTELDEAVKSQIHFHLSMKARAAVVCPPETQALNPRQNRL